MFKWLKKLFGKEEEVQEEIEVERVSLERIDISEPLLKSDEDLETPETRYTEDYAEFVETQLENEEEVVDRSMPIKREKTEEEREAEWLPPESRYTKDYKKFVETQLPSENEEVVTKEVVSEESGESVVETSEEVISEEFNDPFIDDPEEEGSFEEDVYEGETAVYETLLEPLDEEDIYEDE